MRKQWHSCFNLGGGGERVNCNPNLGENRNSGLWLDHILNFAANRTWLRFTFKMNYSFLQSLIMDPPPPFPATGITVCSKFWIVVYPKTEITVCSQVWFTFYPLTNTRITVSTIGILHAKPGCLVSAVAWKQGNVGIWWKSYQYYLRFPQWPLFPPTIVAFH